MHSTSHQKKNMKALIIGLQTCLSPSSCLSDLNQIVPFFVMQFYPLCTCSNCLILVSLLNSHFVFLLSSPTSLSALGPAVSSSGWWGAGYFSLGAIKLSPSETATLSECRDVFLPRGLQGRIFIFNPLITFYGVGHSFLTLPQMAFSPHGRTIVTDWSGFNWLVPVRAGPDISCRSADEVSQLPNSMKTL